MGRSILTALVILALAGNFSNIIVRNRNNHTETAVSIARDVFANPSVFDYRVMGTSRPFIIQIAG